MGKVVVHRHTPPSRIALYWTPDERGITSARFSMPMTSKRSPFSRDAKHHRCQSAKMASMEGGREKEAFLKGTAHKGLFRNPSFTLPLSIDAIFALWHLWCLASLEKG